MNDLPVFIVEQDRPYMLQGVAVLPIFIVIISGALIKSIELARIIPWYLILPFQAITGATLLLFVVGFFVNLIMLSDDAPLATLTSAGIKLKYFGFIPWSNVQQFDVTYVMNTTVACITLIPYESSHLPNQASRIGKMAFFWSSITGNPPITIANTVQDLETIVIKAHQFMAEQERTDRY